jgi:hypothetical protein
MTDNYPHDRAMIDFLNARMDEEEKIAHAAIGTAAFARQTGRWIADLTPAMGNPEFYGYYRLVLAVADTGVRTQAADLSAAWEGEQRAAHIAYHDPAHVLADIAWKRDLLALAADVLAASESPDTSESTREIGNAYVATFLHHTVKSMTRAYRDHPDYQPEWHNTRHQTDRNQT